MRRIALLLVLPAVLFTTVSLAEVKLPKMVGDHMVLQRDAKVRIWGWGDKGEKVKVRFKGKSYSATTGNNGKWEVLLTPIAAGGPYDMVFTGKSNTITLTDIMVGDVWLCTGQSNMVHNMDLHKITYGKDIAAANYPAIRQFLVPTNAILTGPAEDLPEGSWKVANPENVLRFSVVAYFFAKDLYEKYKVPIGLINASVGGTPIEAWISEEGFKDFPSELATIRQNKDTAYVNGLNRRARQFARGTSPKPADKGLLSTPTWFDPAYKPSNWDRMAIPGYWEDQGINDLNGTVWFRREIDVPERMSKVPAHLSMGRIVDADIVYINGKAVGNKTYQYPQRNYDIPPGILKPGKNLIVVKVTNFGGKGGFVPDKPYYLTAMGDTVDLKGYWQYKVGEVFAPRRGGFGGGISAQNQPASLYNGMVAPFKGLPLKGVIWYQGESNTGNAAKYADLLPALVQDVRSQWKQPSLPFLYAQLPNFMDVDYLPSESNWAELRESQRKSLHVPNTAMAVTIDLGEWNDIHPDIKKPIGDRLALAARKIAYNDNTVVYSGPIYASARVEGSQVTLHFDHVGGGLVSSDGEPLRWFALAGEDKKFVWAEATIVNNEVVLTCDDVQRPAYVRYAWADNPSHVNFYNKEGLPASPFEAQLIDMNGLWHGKKAAVVLTYDDALEVQLDYAIKALDSLGLKGTFYLSTGFPGSINRMEDWRRAARNGHELGNHTVFHPCDASKPGRSWVSAGNDLSKYTTEQIVREVTMANLFLQALDGKKERTFAYTCGDMTTGEGSFVDAIKDQFVALRGVAGKLNKAGSMDLTNVNCYVVDNTNADQMQSWAEQAKAENALLVILFHGVGGSHSINVDRGRHNQFLGYLKSHPDDFWVTTLLEASKHTIEQSKKNP